MNDFSKILPTSKLSSTMGNEAVVDLITEEGLYIGFWGQSLKQFDRLYFTKKQVNEFFSRKIRTLIDGRITCTLKEIRDRYNGKIFITGVDTEIDIDKLFENNIKDTVVYCKNSQAIRKFLGTETIDGVKYIYLTPMLNNLESPTESKIKLMYKFNDIKNELTGTPGKYKTLDAIATELYGVKDASFLNITDM